MMAWSSGWAQAKQQDLVVGFYWTPYNGYHKVTIDAIIAAWIGSLQVTSLQHCFGESNCTPAMGIGIGIFSNAQCQPPSCMVHRVWSEG